MDTRISAPSPVITGLLDITSWERLPAALRRSLATLARECGPTGYPRPLRLFTWGGGWAYSAMVGKHEARAASSSLASMRRGCMRARLSGHRRRLGSPAARVDAGSVHTRTSDYRGCSSARVYRRSTR